MADQLNRDEEDLLQSALETAFHPPPLRRVSVASTPTATTPDSPASVTLVASTAPTEIGGTSSEAQVAETAASAPEEEDWKRDYDAHVSSWRARSAEQREKAEAERKRWEELRAQEHEHELGVRTEDLEREAREWESVSMSLGPGSTRVGSVVGEGDGGSPSIADARDLVTGEEQGTGTRRSAGVSEVVSIPQSAVPSPPETSAAGHDRNSGSGEKWEDVPIPSSMTSSYPSLSYPSDPHSPVSSQPHRVLPPHGQSHSHPHPHGDDRRHSQSTGAPVTTATNAIFDSTLSTKTRTLAVLSSLAINLFLPFVNGVMLGFGEIFARNVAVKWFGWGKLGERNARPTAAGTVATSVGVNASSTAGKSLWRS